ncbi:hypothetical protein DM01DRAFT_323343 [Hesseltinella vesiculosa]|uniref:Uncharacterized protein n=1 Tax=Hesseltinella vesiculosa TaxID=101127 RepID=A0A1X2GFJ2_9FUNG|nr:hypothetical protein DM01DRAFT_323343 [Hesseltinella vesiculosa]
MSSVYCDLLHGLLNFADDVSDEVPNSEDYAALLPHHNNLTPNDLTPAPASSPPASPANPPSTAPPPPANSSPPSNNPNPSPNPSPNNPLSILPPILDPLTSITNNNGHNANPSPPSTSSSSSQPSPTLSSANTPSASPAPPQEGKHHHPSSSSSSSSASSLTTPIVQDQEVQKPTSDDNNNATGTIAGGVVGAVVGLALLGGFVTWINRRGGCTKRHRYDRDVDMFKEVPDDHSIGIFPPSPAPLHRHATLNSGSNSDPGMNANMSQIGIDMAPAIPFDYSRRFVTPPMLPPPGPVPQITIVGNTSSNTPSNAMTVPPEEYYPEYGMDYATSGSTVNEAHTSPLQQHQPVDMEDAQPSQPLYYYPQGQDPHAWPDYDVQGYDPHQHNGYGMPAYPMDPAHGVYHHKPDVVDQYSPYKPNAM